MQSQSSLPTLQAKPYWLDSRTAAEMLGCHPKTLERKARRGEVPGHFKLNRWYFVIAELDAWLKGDVRSASANPSAV